MTQAPTWSVPLSGPVSPDVFAQRIDESLDALLSAHSGSARPDYAVAGTIWISTATAGKLKKYLFDGTNDRLLETIDIATGAISYEPGTMTGPVNYANFAITNPAGKWLRGYISPGFNLANNATDATNDIDFPAGVVASDETTPILMDHAAGTAQLDVVYGTGNGGRFSSAAISDGWWHCFVISNGTTVSRGFSKNLDPTADSNYPAGYTHYRRVASWSRESGVLVQLSQVGDVFRRKTAIVIASSVTTIADQLVSTGTPLGIVCAPLINWAVIPAANSAYQGSLGSAADGASNVGVIFCGSTTSPSNRYISNPPPMFFTNTSGQLWMNRSVIAGTINSSDVSCAGWVDTRGRI
ncbi:hypothetical protein [Rhizobium sp. BK060]|uniref:hypothetical protein n=1 Tax=Rhizobium sp. BK060 TaxID=2587096 RepID=UPI00161A9642|nr:hypothetical protein [Rhizobium sp. BK060]MBB3396883.1 hypothetical protein [Rhizobium sp. BK060]